MRTSLLKASVVLLLFSTTKIEAATTVQQTVYGPQSVSVGLLLSTNKDLNFNLAQPVQGALIIRNGSGEDLNPKTCVGKLSEKLVCQLDNLRKAVVLLLDRPKSVEIKLNNQILLAKKDYDAKKGQYFYQVSLLLANKINVAMKGLPGTSIKIEVKADVVTETPNQLPVAKFDISPVEAFVPATVTVNGILSSDSDGNITDYSWDFGDGAQATGVLANHIYQTAGTYDVTLTVRDNRGGSASLKKSVVMKQNAAPLADLKVTSPTTGVAPHIAMFDASASTDPEGKPLSYFWDFGDGEKNDNGPAQVSHEFKSQGSYTVVLVVKDELGLQAQKQAVITVTAPTVPVEPKDLAPPLSDVEVRPYGESIAFLYQGTNPIQKNLQVASLDDRRVGVLKGKIFDEAGNPLSGVKVTVLGAPEFGETSTRPSGEFDIVVNGGSTLTLNFERAGYLPASRFVKARYNDYSFAPDTVMVALDQKVSSVNLGSSAVQIAQGSIMSDTAGDRTAAVVFPSNVTAELEMPDGTTKPVSALNIRATEYTVGDAGLKKMPAPLPPTSGYTYAVELTADEAIAVGAKHIRFSKPVPFYVDNFLDVPVGRGVPLGVLNPDTKLWEAERDGVVLKILSKDSGVAVIDVKGQGQPATQAELDALGVSAEELTKLAQMYDSGKSLWRVSLNHFSSLDLNFMGGKYNTILPASPPTANDNKLVDKKSKCLVCGSIIDVLSRSISEVIPLPGTAIDLMYHSVNTEERTLENVLTIPLTANGSSAVPPDLLRIEYRVEAAGSVFSGVAQPNSNLVVKVPWSGLDAYGRKVPVSAKANVVIKYYVKSFYNIPNSFGGSTFGGAINGSNISISGVSEREGSIITREFQVPIGNHNLSIQAMVAGWSPTIVHQFDPQIGRIYFGYGGSRDISEGLDVIFTKAGVGGDGSTGDGASALSAQLNQPNSIAVGPAGEIYIATKGDGRIRKVSYEGIIETFVSSPGLSQVHVSPKGDMYVVDSSKCYIYKVDQDRNLMLVAGNGVCASSSEGVLAANSSILISGNVAVSVDGNIYFGSGHSIRKIGTDGKLETIAGDQAVSGTGLVTGNAKNARFTNPLVRGIGINGEVYYNQERTIGYISAQGDNRLIISKQPTTANDTENSQVNDTACYKISAVTVANNGLIYFGCGGPTDQRIRKIKPNNYVETTAGYYVFANNVTGEYAAARKSFIAELRDLQVMSDGSLLTVEASGKVRRVAQTLIGNSKDNFNVPSQDGSEIYQFSKTGAHLRTLNAVTGSPIWIFGYDSKKQLISISDNFNQVTTISRGSNGMPLSIVSPGGDQFPLSVYNSGWLSSVTYPTGEKYVLGYEKKGLLTQFITPNGGKTEMAYNEYGELLAETDPAGNAKVLDYSEAGVNRLATLTYANGQREVTSRNGSAVAEDLAGGATIITTNKNGSDKRTIFGKNSWGIADEDGVNEIYGTYTTDPRLGGMVSVSAETNIQVSQPIYQVKNIRTLLRQDVSNLFKFQQLDVLKDGVLEVNKVTDTVARKISTTTNTGRSSVIDFDDNYRPVQMSQGTNLPIEMTYGPNGKISLVKQGDRITQFVYDSRGFLQKIVDPLQREVVLTKDALGRTLQIDKTDGSNVKLAYDKNSNIVGIQPYLKDWHEFVFTLTDLFSVYKMPSLGSGQLLSSYFYDSGNRLTKYQRADGVTVDYVGGAERPSEIRMNSSPAEVLNRNYFDMYNPHDITAGFAGSGITTTIRHIASVPYKQDTEFAISGIVDPSIGYDYVGAGDIGKISISDSISANDIIYQYNPNREPVAAGDMTLAWNQSGQLSGVQLGSVVEGFGYSGYGELSSYESAFGSAKLLSYSVTRDQLGRITEKKETLNSVLTTKNYAYDLSGRLSEVKNNGVIVEKYSYDSNGNRLEVQKGAEIVASSYDAQDRLIQRGNVVYAYNLEGELTQKTEVGGVTKYTYGLMNQLIKVELRDGRKIEYGKDGRGYRAFKKVDGVYTDFYVWNTFGQLQIAYGPQSSGKTLFVYGTQGFSPDYMVRGGVEYKFIKDNLGSIRLVVNSSSGDVVQRLDYDEWGNVVADSNPGFQPFGFVGGVYDKDTNLVRFGVRDYDPETGRWTTKDPISFAGGDANLYVYVLSDPINLIDPRGTEFKFANQNSAVLLDSLYSKSNSYGRSLIDKLRKSSKVYTISLCEKGTNDFDSDTNVLSINTRSDKMRVGVDGDGLWLHADSSPERVLAHELGHAFLGGGSEGAATRIENTIYTPIDGYTRIPQDY